MTLMTWTDALSVNLPEIDAEHQQLVSLINDLHATMKDGTALETLDVIFSGLVDYTVHHFAHEERLMRAARYPQYPTHKRQHDDLTSRVVALQEKFADGGRTTVTLETMAFLKNWLTTHIMDIDRQMGAFVAARPRIVERPQV